MFGDFDVNPLEESQMGLKIHELLSVYVTNPLQINATRCELFLNVLIWNKHV